MSKLHHMAKYFSSSGSNRKNYNNMLFLNLYFPTNQLEQDLNGTRISSLCKLMRSTLRAKADMIEGFRLHELEPFMTDDEWKATREFEGALRETSRLTTMCQNEDKLNSAHGPVMRKVLDDGLSCETMKVMITNDLISNK